MDKKLILAVAGSGKTTHIVDSLSNDKRSIIITYTNNNYENLRNKIFVKNKGIWPENVTLLTFFKFLYNFCYKPFFSDRVKARGIIYEQNPNRFLSDNERLYYLTDNGFFYHSRLSLFLQKCGLKDIINRLETYFDELIIDEIQDIAGRDFTFIECLMDANINMLFVGDFFQHTFNTSRDGNTNGNLYNDYSAYQKRFRDKGFVIDKTTLLKSWRCGAEICEYVTEKLGIEIHSNREDRDSFIQWVNTGKEGDEILANSDIIKLHYKESQRHGRDHRNWGEVKGVDSYKDVCILLNKTTMSFAKSNNLWGLPQKTKNGLYVAITRAHRNCYLMEEL